MKRFTKTIENFICDHCGTCVTGTGYTNHCPKCLWSKHVDENPGDRASLCEGAMEPQSVVVLSSVYRIMHKCARCGFIRLQDASKEDNIECLIELSAQPFKKL
jgi:rubrerythrin